MTLREYLGYHQSHFGDRPLQFTAEELLAALEAEAERPHTHVAEGASRSDGLTLDEVALQCGRRRPDGTLWHPQPATVRLWIRTGLRSAGGRVRLRAYRLGREYRVHPRDLVAFLAEVREPGPTPLTDTGEAHATRDSKTSAADEITIHRGRLEAASLGRATRRVRT